MFSQSEYSNSYKSLAFHITHHHTSTRLHTTTRTHTQTKHGKGKHTLSLGRDDDTKHVTAALRILCLYVGTTLSLYNDARLYVMFAARWACDKW